MTKFYFIQMFANANTQTTVVGDAVNPNLSATMKEYYDTELLENARANLVFNQFSKKQPVPKNNGKTVEWRHFEPFNDATSPLTEGVTPDGNTLKMSSITANILQYGDYTTVSDVLDNTAVDPIILACTEEHAAQAASTLDVLTRNVLDNMLQDGINVSYAPLVGADGAITEVTKDSDVTAAMKMSPLFVNKLVTRLKKAKAPRIDGKYIMFIHPSCAEDLRESDAWIEAHKYAATTELFNGEIGELHGVRFVETTQVKVKKSGSGSGAVYYNYIFGKDAFATTDLEGAGLEMIIKPLGAGDDPLNQRQTIGWKASHAAAVLHRERIIRAVCGSSYSGSDEAN